ncbi:MAG: 50S ribosomal protein L9 [Parcubacteria group bacterium GW2011_GWD2_43_10]|uniref:Large ribosomal subunit protein bL9 n=3 Tax=Candidatus Vebleniibacteriota TaxID=1817921 RepID=A0A1G2Q9U6_9BACT|nr:MAG: 50S ribosomal protein L9 [Parcubacteria group bacterium GW2011_GWA2_42_80]KKS79039.1 MAG: 50S ribosomal protein L9 [Parcubacteria group bacterium GW2011_GWD1_42_9]KKS84064.1 MAG: 50S ribosomal protein L9 [Parcubacteria group bacterium GW2011_GWD2_43_10]KKS92632.1 MAG: 50S ribosomal protein L9 [Parcubacteria group bacterium GW2011_GWE2_43_12]KKT12597.1 MAG: 50S ribosomal protein L9 [Parcubacteria group bacterium GW2011_GWA1_43_27]KKT15040.1 MAG: 50S ribosomal protein L9 [Parcubacteria g
MKVIFTKEVAGVARGNDVREVADGFALNYLLPRGLAVRATPEKIQALAQHQEATKNDQINLQNKAHNLADELNGKTVTIIRPASTAGTLYAAVSGEMVAEAVKQQLKVNLLPNQIDVPHHVKTIGQHQVKINLSQSVSAFINLQINAT